MKSLYKQLRKRANKYKYKLNLAKTNVKLIKNVNIDFYNWEIITLAEEWGQDVSTEKKQDYILSCWFDFITNKFFQLCKKHKVEV
jgi:hypothetical protein